MSDLVKLEKVNILTLFTENKVDPILEAITNEVKGFVPDISTEKGRKEVASLAYKVAKSKTYLDDLGKDLVSEWKEKSKLVDNSRKKIRDYLDNLKDEVRAPLTAWENKEINRIRSHESNIEKLESFLKVSPELTSEVLREELASLKAFPIDDSWEEFHDRAARIKESGLKFLTEALSKRLLFESEQAELKRLREEALEREKLDREKRIAEEAALKAKQEAEAKAKEEALKIERQKQEELRKAKEETDRIENEKLEAVRKQKEAEERVKQEQERSKQAALKAEQDRIESEKRAREQERLKIEKEKELEAQALAKREADINHRKKINNAALTALEAIEGVSKQTARLVVEAIAKGEIPNIRINY